MEDIGHAVGAITRTAGEVGMTRVDLEKAKDLLQKYGDDRERLFDLMLSLLKEPGRDSLSDDWKDACEKGMNLLERLNSAVPNSPIGECLPGIGARDFYDGEKKIWIENGKAQLALVAGAIAKVKAADVGLKQQGSEDLSNLRARNDELQSSLRECLDGIGGNLSEVRGALVSQAGDSTLTAWIKEKSAKEFITKWRDAVVPATENILTIAREKSELKKKLLSSIESLNGVRDQLDERWIDDMYLSGEDCSKSLVGVGETGDYRALDWSRFGQSSLGHLSENRDDAEEKAKALFSEFLPSLQEESSARYIGLTDDPSKLTDWTSNVRDQQQAVQELLSSEDEAIKGLAEGPYQTSARETFEEFRNIFTDTMKNILDTANDAEGQLRA